MEAFGFTRKPRGYWKGGCVCTNYSRKFSQGAPAQLLAGVENAKKMQDTSFQTSASESRDAIADAAPGKHTLKTTSLETVPRS